MSVTTTNKKLSFTGTGDQSSQTVTFEFYATSEIRVVKVVTATGARTELTLDTHYSVTGGSGSTGAVVPISGATNFPATVTWEVERVTPLTQTYTYTASGPFSDSSHADAIDKGAMRHQEMLRAIPNAESTNAATMTLDQEYSTAHSLTFPPKHIRAYAQCLSAEHGYAVGDEVAWGIGGMATGADVTAAGGITVWADATNLSFYVCETNNPAVRSLTTGSLVAITLASWKFFVHGWW